MSWLSKSSCFGLLIGCCTRLLSQDVEVMTFNIRYDNKNDKEDGWAHRRYEVAKMIEYYSPTIFGIQEGLHHQVTYLDSMLTEYKYVGVGREDGETRGEYAAIFYRNEEVALESTQTYWLSETPNQVSVGWDASMERITTFGRFRDKATTKMLSVFNCHFDHRGSQSRLNAAQLILKLIEEKDLGDEKLIVMGDLNCQPDDPPMMILKQSLSDPLEGRDITLDGPTGTWNGFNDELIIDKRIDFILIKNLEMEEYIHIDDRRKNNLFLSDHLPVLVKVRMR